MSSSLFDPSLSLTDNKRKQFSKLYHDFWESDGVHDDLIALTSKDATHSFKVMQGKDGDRNRILQNPFIKYDAKKAFNFGSKGSKEYLIIGNNSSFHAGHTKRLQACQQSIF